MSIFLLPTPLTLRHAHVDASQHSDAPRRRRARRVAVPYSGAPRRMRQRPHDALLQQLRDRLGRTAAQYIDVERTATTPERFLRAVAATVAVSGQRRRAGRRARAPSTRRSRSSRRARTGGRRAGDVPARRISRAAHVRKLSGPAPRAARVRRRPGGERQPVRPDQPVRGAHAAAAARPVGALRSHSRAAAYGRRHARHPGARRPLPASRTTAEFVARTVQALADGRPAYVRAARRRAGRDARARPRPGGLDRRSDQRARGAARAGRPARAAVRASATSSGCTARAATARSRRSSKSSRRKKG